MKEMIFVFALLASLKGWSNAGHDQGGGGDLCEDRIKIIRDDLGGWIQNGGPRGLTLPANTSVEQYSASMLGAMATTRIRCVGAGDLGFPVQVNGTAKTCRYDWVAGQGQITCDYDKFHAIAESDQYVLVHHEYAGLAGLELPNGDDSVYTISNQIAGFLEDQIVKKLVVKPAAPPANEAPFDPQTCAGDPMTAREFLSYFSAGGEPAKIAEATKMVYRERKCLGPSENLCTDWKYTTDGSVSITLSIDEHGQPGLWAEFFRDYCGYGCSDIGSLDGILTSQVQLSNDGFHIYWSDWHSVIPFKGTGRLTKGCLVLTSKVDQEHEAGFVLRFGPQH